MTIDRANFDYIASDFHPRILWEVKPANGLGTKFEYRTQIKQVAERLARRKPNWRFIVSSNVYASTGLRILSTIRVYEGDEYLGMFWHGYNYSRSLPEVCIDCRTLAAKRSRGSSTRTTDMNKALKIIETNFVRLSLKEAAERKLHEARVTIAQAQSEKRTLYSNLLKDISPAAVKFLTENFAEIQDRIGVTPELMSSYLTACDDLAAVTTMRAISDNKASGLVLYVSGDTYVAVNWQSGLGDNQPPTYTSDTLPLEYKAKLGMLKLVGAGSLITGVGARVTEDTYILTNDK